MCSYQTLKTLQPNWTK